MAKPISFKDVEVDTPWEIEKWQKEQNLRHEAHIEKAAGMGEETLIRQRRFSYGSTTEGPDEVNL